MKKKILMIGTGGTIASKQTEHGLAPGLSSEDILSYIPQVESVCDVDTLQGGNIQADCVILTVQMLLQCIGDFLQRRSKRIMRSMTDLLFAMEQTHWHIQRRHYPI